MQTLEPRLLYVRVPFEDQSTLPVFDTILPDFNLIQLFRKYQFVGPDRIADTDQFSFGVTTRLIDAANGRERLTATLGQTRYLNPQRVTLPGTLPNETDARTTWPRVGIGVRDAWALDVGYQWNSETSLDGARPKHASNSARRTTGCSASAIATGRGSLEQGDVSLVWPVADSVGGSSAATATRSSTRSALEEFVGWEYEACCWRLRMVNRNYVSRRTGESRQLDLASARAEGVVAGASQRRTTSSTVVFWATASIARAY